MKNIFTCLLFILAFAGLSRAQESNSTEPCHTEINFREMAKENPQLIIDRKNYEVELAKFLAANPEYRTASGVKKVIPVVFHVIHDYGPENISRAQILDCIRILNEDFQRQNADTTNTPAPFKSLAGNPELEFRLAQLDPSGNCTEGIVRVYSPLTSFARNNVKALSYWPSNKYMNMWTVKYIDPSDPNPTGTTFVAGYSQFPGGGPSTDGSVLRHETIGTIGSASGSNMYRTPTHEIGHWLNLIHIWGDASCGDDNVDDTPTQEAANQSNCPAFPHISPNCIGNPPDGDMFTNFMDYTRSSCQNMFSVDQSIRMNNALTAGGWTRKSLHTGTNLIETGTDGTPASTCPPIAEFNTKDVLLCEGTPFTFVDKSYNATPNSWTWTVNGGTPSSSNDQNPIIAYNTPGVYDVSLVAGSTGGNSAVKTKKRHITVLSSAPTKSLATDYFEGFESSTFPPDNDWVIQSFDSTNKWTRTKLAAATDSSSIMVNCRNGSNVICSKDAIITPSFDLSGVATSSFTFKLAYAQTVLSSVGTDKLDISVSTDCGKNWTLRRTLSNTALATVATAVPGIFTPTSSQWRQETVSLASVNNKSNVRIKFEFTVGKYSNNIYIDDINIKSLTGVHEILASQLNFSIFPNPSNDKITIQFTLAESANTGFTLYDIVGKEVMVIKNGILPIGEHQFVLNSKNELPAGIYFVKLSVNNKDLMQKLIIE